NKSKPQTIMEPLAAAHQQIRIKSSAIMEVAIALGILRARRHNALATIASTSMYTVGGVSRDWPVTRFTRRVRHEPTDQRMRKLAICHRRLIKVCLVMLPKAATKRLWMRLIQSRLKLRCFT